MLSKPPSNHNVPPTRKGQSVTLLTHARNPSHVVRSIYLAHDKCSHPFVSGATAQAIAKELGEELVDPSYFYTEPRWREHRRGLGLPEEPLPYPPESEHKEPLDPLPKGTVGAVALDTRGCIASVTSTGGRTNKLAGRIGDTPHMGSGFWAEEWQIKRWRHLLTKLCHPFRDVHKTRAVGISGTGEGDVRVISPFPLVPLIFSSPSSLFATILVSQ